MGFHRFLRGIAPTWARGEAGERFVGVLLGIMADTTANAAAEASRLAWFHAGGVQPADALPLLGTERGMPRYPIESDAQYRDRLWGAWDAWEFAGNESAIVSQYESAGFGGVELKEPFRTHSDTGNTHGDWHREPFNYWSQFWIFLPVGVHNFVGGVHTYDEVGLEYDDGAVYDSLLTVGDVALLRGIVNKWRPAHVICREIVIELEGPTYDTGHVFDEPGLVFGSTENVAVSGT